MLQKEVEIADNTEAMIMCRYDGLFQFNEINHIYDGPCQRIAMLRRIHDEVISDGHEIHLSYVGALMLVAMEPFNSSPRLPGVIDTTDDAIRVLLPALLEESIKEAHQIAAFWKSNFPLGVATLPAPVLRSAHSAQYDYWTTELLYLDVTDPAGEG